ncbi:hypothetical protein [Salinibacterium sp. M195]|uniref:hypothetical protein n=1 Tax=Salinibacterium sp. M195 TaxID=2583374 RepID=UPI001C62FBD4|nr:hypothetical protein [Salinibacterium sp. M195]QYH36913.1 hypothetical protein FFT87_13770 [Salinibacterium sp. M195]
MEKDLPDGGVDYGLAWSIATEVVQRIEVRFPRVRIDVHGPSEMAHGVNVEFRPSEPRATYAEVFVAYDGAYVLNVGSHFHFEGGGVSDNSGDTADEIVEHLEEIGTTGLAGVTGFSLWGLVLATWFGSPETEGDSDDLERSWG